MRPDRKAQCPIPGCHYTFRNGIIGWHKHIAAVVSHPSWHPELTDPIARKAAFKREYPRFLPAFAHPQHGYDAMVPAEPAALAQRASHITELRPDTLIERSQRLIEELRVERAALEQAIDRTLADLSAAEERLRLREADVHAYTGRVVLAIRRHSAARTSSNS